MAKATKPETTTSTNVTSNEELELRKVKALEKIANSLDALTIWFEEINKDEWSERLQYYLYEFHNNIVTGKKEDDK